MKSFWPILLILGIVAGQVIKFPQSTQGGLTLLDLSVITLVIYGFLKVRTKILPPPNWVKAGLIFIGIAGLSLILTPLKLTPEQYALSISYPLRFLLYLLLGWLIYKKAFPSLRPSISKILIFSGTGLAILGLLQLVFLPNLGFLAPSGWDPHYFRTASTLLDPNFLGAFLVLTLLVLLNQKFHPLIFFINYLALVTTFSRSTAIMFGVSFLTFAVIKKSPKLLLLTFILSLGFGLGFLGYRQMVTKPRNIDRGQSAQYRLSSWEQGWKFFQSSPIFGVGFNTYRFALKEYNLAPEDYTESRGASGSDSSLLFLAATTGIVGLAAYLYFLISLASKNKLLIAAITGLLVHSIFVNSLFYPWVLIWIILMSSKES